MKDSSGKEEEVENDRVSGRTMVWKDGGGRGGRSLHVL